ncbi:MAG: thermonuclease family protein [Candidatus Pacebacteria bacterium]|nr:thermonuclease family protein [Candidatus Paceibacterota bacterium]
MKKIKTKAIITALSLLLASSGIIGYKIVKTKNYGGTSENLHKVLRVIDGDTFEVAGTSEKDDNVVIRILNTSAPEKYECYFKESTDFLKDLIQDKEVRLEKDISGTDNFGRLLRHVFVPSDSEEEDNLLISQYLIENGFAKAIPTPPDFRYKTHLANVENKASKNDLGIWGNCQGQLPHDFQEGVDEQPKYPNCIIKGNISTNGGLRWLYYTPDCSNYTQTKINTEKGEAYFCTEEEAQNAGFTRSPSCDNSF